MPRLLLTGSSGYIGSTLLIDLLALEDLDVYALIRTESQQEAVTKLGAKPVEFSLEDASAIVTFIDENDITIVIHTADAISYNPAEAFVKGLEKVKYRTGRAVHFVFTSGAKLFSTHVGINRLLNDNKSEDIYVAQEQATAGHPSVQMAVQTCTKVLSLGDKLGVCTYVYVPPMVYGPGKGFGNKISIQFVALVRIGVKMRSMYQTADPSFTWPLCHLDDVVSLYMTLVRAMLGPPSGFPPHGKAGGYYFAENGSFNWMQISNAIGASLAKRDLVDGSGTLNIENDGKLEHIAQVIGVPKELVDFSIGGQCLLRGDNGRALGWSPQYGLAHLQKAVDNEVEFVLKNDKALSNTD